MVVKKLAAKLTNQNPPKMLRMDQRSRKIVTRSWNKKTIQTTFGLLKKMGKWMLFVA